eukprot:1555050-Ditylum_brightwellii.AAC.1
MLKEDLLRYILHERRNGRLTAQWNITSETKFSKMKENQVIVHRLNYFKSFINATNITEIVQEKAGFYLFSHHKYTSCNSAHYKVNSWLQEQTNSAGGFDLGAQTVRVSKGKKVFETKAIVHTLGKEQRQLQKSALYKITSWKERQKWTQTGNWQFIPFSPDGEFTINQIVACVKLQNKFIGSVNNMTVTGFHNINAYVTNPRGGGFAPF